MATPTEWLNEFQVNTDTAATGFQSSSQIIGLSNGNFLVAWEENSNGLIGTALGSDIIGKIYNAEGNVVRNSFQINTIYSSNDEGDFDIQSTNDGGFIIVYVDESPNSTAIRWERFNSLGNLSRFTTIASEGSTILSLANPQIAVNLLDNTSVVTFTETEDLPDGDDFIDNENANIRGRAVSAIGTLPGIEFDAAQNSSDRDAEGAIAVLADGNYVSVYEENDGSPLSFRDQGIEFKIFDSNGNPLLPPSSVRNIATSGESPDVALLANGDFVVRHPRQSRWLDKCDRPKGGCPC